MKEKKTIIAILIAAFIVLLLCCCTVSAVIFFNKRLFRITPSENEQDPISDYDYTEEPDASEQENEEDASTEEEGEEEAEVTEATTGTITGSVSYPSEFIPDGMTICAEPDADTDSYCTTDLIEQTAALPIYELEVPPGDYYVYAYDANGDPDYTAYYSEFVTCGLSVECDSHDPILVTVAAGETVEGVDPGDWYNF